MKTMLLTIMDHVEQLQCQLALFHGASPAQQIQPVAFVNSATIFKQMDTAILIMDFSKPQKDKFQALKIIVNQDLQDILASSATQAIWFPLLMPVSQFPDSFARSITVQVAPQLQSVLYVKMDSMLIQLEYVLNTNVVLLIAINAQTMSHAQVVSQPIILSITLVCGNHMLAMLKTVQSVCITLKIV